MFEIVFSLNLDFVQESNFDFSTPYLFAEQIDTSRQPYT
jgi:hypothetical protein